MKAWGGAVFPVLVNMAVDTVDGSCRRCEEAQQSSRTLNASRCRRGLRMRRMGHGVRQKAGRFAITPALRPIGKSVRIATAFARPWLVTDAFAVAVQLALPRPASPQASQGSQGWGLFPMSALHLTCPGAHFTMHHNTLDAPEYTIDVPITAHYERFVAAQRAATHKHSQFIHIHQITIPTCPKSFSHTSSLHAACEWST